MRVCVCAFTWGEQEGAVRCEGEASEERPHAVVMEHSVLFHLHTNKQTNTITLKRVFGVCMIVFSVSV